VSERDFFRQQGATTSFSKSGDGKDGKFSAGVLRNQGTGASGQGTVLSVRFKAVAAGAAEVRLSGAQSIGLGAVAPAPALPAPFAVQIH